MPHLWVLAMLIAGSMLTGGVIGASLTTRDERPAQVGNVTIDPAGPTFDSAGFRAGEREPSHPQPAFDAVGFRAEEHGLSAP
jgi:hypothetical protein